MLFGIPCAGHFPSMRSQVPTPIWSSAPYNAITLASSIHTRVRKSLPLFAFESTTSTYLVQRFSKYLILVRASPPSLPLGVYHMCKQQEAIIPNGRKNAMLRKSSTITFRGTAKIPAPHPALLLEAHPTYVHTYDRHGRSNRDGTLT